VPAPVAEAQDGVATELGRADGGGQRAAPSAGASYSPQQYRVGGCAIPTFFRVVRTNPPTDDAFLPNKALDKPPPVSDDPQLLALLIDLWENGLSVFDTRERAVRKTGPRRLLGSFIAELSIPDDSALVRYAPSLGTGHFTLRGAPHHVRACVVSVTQV
jgi:hypothetical protein